jgi:hypothetical protein
MEESPYTVTVFNKKSYKIIHVDGTTVTYQLGFWERVLSFLYSIRRQAGELLDEAKDWIQEKIGIC